MGERQMSTSSCGRRYEGRRCEGWLAFWERQAGRKSRGEKGRAREMKAESCARRARESEKGKNERGGETGKRDEAEIQKILTS